MLKENVLRKNWQFQDIIDLKNQKVSKYLVFYFRENKETTRIGISISKKFANAVWRNRYRRQVRHALDIIGPWKQNKDIVLILRKSFLKLSFEEKINELRKMFERL